MKVGQRFKLFGKGSLCQVTAIKGGKVRYQMVGSLITGSFPVERMHEHSKRKSHGSQDQTASAA